MSHHDDHLPSDQEIINEAMRVVRLFERIGRKASGATCPECGTRFHPSHQTAETCSPACRQRRSRRLRGRHQNPSHLRGRPRRPK